MSRGELAAVLDEVVPELARMRSPLVLDVRVSPSTPG